MRGFEDELRFSGMATDLILRHGRAPVSFEHGVEMTSILLEREPKIDAVFAVSDLSAVGMVMECLRRGVDVPGELSIMGFGDFEIGLVINPPLTTVHVNFRALGRRTGELILGLLADGDTEAPKIIDVGLKVVERASVKSFM